MEADVFACLRVCVERWWVAGGMGLVGICFLSRCSCQGLQMAKNVQLSLCKNSTRQSVCGPGLRNKRIKRRSTEG